MTDYFIASVLNGITYTMYSILITIVLRLAYVVFSEDDDDDEGGGTPQPVYSPTN